MFEARVKHSSIGLVAITEDSVDKAFKLFRHFPESRLFVPKHALGRIRDNSKGPESSESLRGVYPYEGQLKEVIRLCFQSYEGVVIFGSTGIVVRMLSPYLQDKTRDPGVVVVDQEGSYAISLLSGHLGGGNELARALGRVLGAQPIVTTASDLQSKMTPDLLAFLWGMDIEGIETLRVKQRLKKINADIVADKPVFWLADEELTDQTSYGHRPFEDQEFPHFVVCQEAKQSELSNYTRRGPVVLITDRVIPEDADHEDLLILRPKRIVAGVGCKRGAAADDILDWIHTGIATHGLSHRAIRGLVSIQQKRSEPGLLAAARYLGVPVNFYPKEALKPFVLEEEQSDFVNQRMGVGGVCEPAVKAECGAQHIIAHKMVNRETNVTLALGRVGWPQWALDPAGIQAYQ